MSRHDTKPATNGHGPRGPITRDDLEAKLRDITGDVSSTVDTARGIGVAVAVGTWCTRPSRHASGSRCGMPDSHRSRSPRRCGADWRRGRSPSG